MVLIKQMQLLIPILINILIVVFYIQNWYHIRRQVKPSIQKKRFVFQ
jgi:hypothetical protein